MAVNDTTTNQTGTTYLSSYKRYTAILNQIGTDAPQAFVLNSNDANFIGNIVWTRIGVGNYLGTLANAFPAYRTFIPPFGGAFNGGSNPSMMLPVSNAVVAYFQAIPTGDEDTVSYQFYDDLAYSNAVEQSTIQTSVLIDIFVLPAS